MKHIFFLMKEKCLIKREKSRFFLIIYLMRKIYGRRMRVVIKGYMIIWMMMIMMMMLLLQGKIIEILFFLINQKLV